MDATAYLKRILTARVYDVVHETPLDPAPGLSARLGHTVLLKREDLQPVFSFKVRGAYNKMALLSADQLSAGVIAASAGNHAQGVALAARLLHATAVIVMPRTTPQVKVAAVRAAGAEVVLHGESFTDAYEHAVGLGSARGLTFVHPFDDPDVIAGQGTIGMEILRQRPSGLDAIFVAVGGGGVIGGIAAYAKALRPDIKVIGVQTDDSDAMTRSLAAGHRVELDRVGLFSDGTAVRVVGEETFRLAQAYVDEMITVDTDAVCAAIKDVFTDTRAILEPAGALALAGLKEYAAGRTELGETYVAVATGANMDFDRLRFVSERAEVGERREAIFAVTIPEERGSFRAFIDVIGPGRAVTEFSYRIASASAAHVFVGVQISGRAEAEALAAAFAEAGLAAVDLTDDELAKSHVRHLVGGRSRLAHDERLYRFEFPERPGALVRFLATMSPEWNISLFHYRNHGSDVGRVLVGMQVPPCDRDVFARFLDRLGYAAIEETDNPAYALFLRD
ncbi:MAG: threonine ammonia-lyase, biosynthetic [Nostocoides sp.]